MQKNCDVYTSMLILLVSPDKKCTHMKAALRAANFLPPSATCPVMTVTAPKCFPDAYIDNQATILPVIYFQGTDCSRSFWSSRSTTTATCLTPVK